MSSRKNQLQPATRLVYASWVSLRLLFPMPGNEDNGLPILLQVTKNREGLGNTGTSKKLALKDSYMIR